MDNRLRPIGTIIPELVHKRDQGPLKIVKYGTIQSIEVEVYRCGICGEEFDFTDWDSISSSAPMGKSNGRRCGSMDKRNPFPYYWENCLLLFDVLDALQSGGMLVDCMFEKQPGGTEGNPSPDYIWRRWRIFNNGSCIGYTTDQVAEMLGRKKSDG